MEKGAKSSSVRLHFYCIFYRIILKTTAARIFCKNNIIFFYSVLFHFSLSHQL